jgi:hypothetical protein
MSNNDDTSKLVRTPRVCELRDDEVVEVSGGVAVNYTMFLP